MKNLDCTGKHHLEFAEEGHEYRLDGLVIPSGSKILKPYSNYDRIRPDVLQRAADFGSAVHQATELFDLDDLDEDVLSPELVPYLDGWKNFKTDTGTEIIHIEARVASPSHRFAVTPDRIMRINGKLAVGEIKTTAALMPSVYPQTAAQKFAYEEWTGEKLAARYCIHLNPKHPRGYKLVPCKDTNDFNIFVAALVMHTWRTKHGID